MTIDLSCPNVMNKLAPELTSTQIQCLKNQRFSDHEPGTLVKDFTNLLDFIGSTGIPVSKKNHLFAIKLLPQLNQLMSNPLDVKLVRPQQKSFPHINGLYLLLRASGLTRIVSEKKGPKLVINNEVLANWQSLNPTECYFALFYAWWHRGSDEIIGESNQGLLNYYYFYPSEDFFQRNLNKSLDIKTDHHNLEFLRYTPGFHNLALMELFGFIQIDLNSRLSKENWPIVKIKQTAWGQALLNCFSKRIEFYEDKIFELRENDPAESWGSEIKPYIPSWKKSLVQAETVGIKEGVVIFKVSLGKAYRKLAVPSNIDLDEFANSILSAFDFSNDHLYEFIVKNDYGITERIAHSYVESDYELNTSEYLVGKLPLSEGSELIFRFDFGDDWRFLLLVESITTGTHAPDVKIIEQRGTSPEQYPDWG